MVAERLTKKQKKASAFRDRKGKTRGEDETLDVPQADGPDVPEAIVDDSYAPVEEKVEKKRAEKKVKEGKKKAEDVPETPAPVKPASKKRKREEEAVKADGAATAVESTAGSEVGGAGSHKKKRRKGAAVEEAGENEGEDKNRRLILFVGNLKYTTSREAIAAHFSACDPPPSVRLLTPKAAKPGATVNKSKGCAFLEFSAKSALQQALKLHNSDLEGRRINVELTAGGGGKSDARLEKLKKRNTELNTQRKKKVDKGDDGAVQPRTQRFSTTSGEGEAPSGRRTWTVGDVQEEETHRGGKNAKKRGAKKTKPREWGTGMNAIPVG
ncbi:unnamed protein product [Peniophora sp. CBMAI 1063]|nr:unnamed protein product [Peniophora sp. CBMAI 1063]